MWEASGSWKRQTAHSPQRLLEVQALILASGDLFRTSELQKCKIINVYC